MKHNSTVPTEFGITLVRRFGAFVLWCIVIFTSHFSSGQIYPYLHYTTKEGLSNNTVFSIEQDSAGYMWFGTSNGLNKFDGYTFEKFYKGDGMNSNSVSSMFLDQSKTLWISNGEAGYCKWKNSGLEKIKLKPDRLTRTDGFSIFQNNLYFLNWSHFVVFDLKKNESKTVDSITNSRIKIHPMCLLSTRSGELLFGTDVGLIKEEKGTYIRTQIKGLDNAPVYSLCEGSDSSLYAGSIGKIFKIKGTQVIDVIPTNVPGIPVTRLSVDQQDHIWFFMVGYNDMFVAFPSDKRIVPLRERMGMDKCIVNFIKTDIEGNVWISIFGKGVYCFYNFFIENFLRTDGLESPVINCINKVKSGVGENILVGTYDGLFMYDHNKFSHLTFYSNSLEYIKFIEPALSASKSLRIKDNNPHAFVGLIKLASKMFYGEGFKKFLNNKLELNYINANAVHVTKDSFALGFWDNKLRFSSTLNYDEKGFSSHLVLYPEIDKDAYVRINKIISDTIGNYWVGTSRGLVIIDSQKHLTFPVEFTNHSISDIVKDDAGKIWVGGDDVLYYFHHGKWTNIGKYGLSGFNFSSIAFDNNNRAWVGTANGLLMIDEKSMLNVEEQDIPMVGLDAGLPSENIKALFFDKQKNELWIGTEEGLSRLNLSAFEKAQSRAADIDLISADTGNSYLADLNDINLPFENNFLKLKYHIHSANAKRAVRLQYNFDDEGWKDMDDPQFEFTGLKRGGHTLQVRTLNRISPAVRMIQTKIYMSPPFYDSWYFRSCILLLAMVLVAFLVKLRINRVKQRAQGEIETENKINALQNQALSAMMNPHFIFNALNSFQYFLNSNQKEKANEYLVKLAQLIRKNLDYSEHAFIPVKFDIERLRSYLELEQMRFGGDLNYVVHVDDELNSGNILIPNFIVQPFVENSVWHGLKPSVRDKWIKVDFVKSSDNILIRIIDNGVGINHGKKEVTGNSVNNSSEHISHGIKVVTERLRLLSSKNSQKFRVKNSKTVEDEQKNILISENNAGSEFPTGTTVIITLSEDMIKTSSEVT